MLQAPHEVGLLALGEDVGPIAEAGRRRCRWPAHEQVGLNRRHDSASSPGAAPTSPFSRFETVTPTRRTPWVGG